MLEQKLAEASQAARKKRLKLGLFLFGATAFSALFLFGVIRLDFGALGIGSDARTEVVESDPAISFENAVVQESTQSAQSIDRPIQAAPTSSDAPDNEVATENPADREAFKSALSAFDQDIRPAIETDGFTAWDNAASIEILAKRDEAMSAFSVGEYASALIKVGAAADQSKKKITAFEDAYNKAFQDADIAYQAEDVALAELNITEALRLKPDATAATELKTQIDRLPKVLSLIKESVTARIENDLQREAILLREIIDLDLTREEQKARLATVNATISESRFSSYISRGMAGVEQRDLKTAETNHRKAESLYKSRDAVKLLSSQVASLKLELGAEELVKKGIAASTSDDWEKAATYFIGARKVLPDNKEALDGHMLASKIINLQKLTAKHLANPERLSNESVVASVEVMLEEAKVFSDFSTSLKVRSQELAAFVIVYSTPVPVQVVSDGVTQVSVRGVGQVGQTTGRTINLKPGTYSFEGKRPGYISTLIKVEIAPGAAGITVEVICDEPI